MTDMKNISEMKRRQFIDFMGRGVLIAPAIPSLLASCDVRRAGDIDSSKFPTSQDDLILADGLDYSILIKEGEPINDLMNFGTENDFLAYFPESNSEGILWVNHEGFSELFVSGYKEMEMSRTRNQIRKEMLQVGGSIIRIKNISGKWEVVKNDPSNYRVTGASKIPFEWPELVEGYRSAVGTLANCAGGKTPWGTALTCEENYQDFYGEYDYDTDSRSAGWHQWQSFYPKHHPHHYGWVVEVNLETGSARKQISLGRMAHECATVKELDDKRVVIYTADDKVGGSLYKYISDEPGKIYPGNLYVANLESGSWELLDISRSELKDTFEDQTELLIRTRLAAELVGGSALDRPEDIAIDPITGAVLVTLTNNKPKGKYHGSIMRIDEGKGNYESMTFTHDTFLAGGEEGGFSCPDNMAFDASGNLWICSDISESAIGKEPYEAFGNNGLFVLIRNGESAGNLYQVASAPNDAEFTGPCFMPDGETLLLSVQHPGTQTQDMAELTSNWPGGGTTVPLSAVVAIKGEIIKLLNGLSK